MKKSDDEMNDDEPERAGSGLVRQIRTNGWTWLVGLMTALAAAFLPMACGSHGSDGPRVVERPAGGVQVFYSGGHPAEGGEVVDGDGRAVALDVGGWFTPLDDWAPGRTLRIFGPEPEAGPRRLIGVRSLRALDTGEWCEIFLAVRADEAEPSF